jgi:hypothetical protein
MLFTEKVILLILECSTGIFVLTFLWGRGAFSKHWSFVPPPFCWFAPPLFPYPFVLDQNELKGDAGPVSTVWAHSQSAHKSAVHLWAKWRLKFEIRWMRWGRGRYRIINTNFKIPTNFAKFYVHTFVRLPPLFPLYRLVFHFHFIFTFLVIIQRHIPVIQQFTFHFPTTRSINFWPFWRTNGWWIIWWRRKFIS